MIRNYAALVAFFDARAKIPFAWGDAANDCVSHALAAVEAQTGIRHKLPARWKTKRGAALALERLGGLEAATGLVLRPIPVAHAHRGDVAGVRNADSELQLMIFDGPILRGPGANGVRILPRKAATLAWSAV